MDVDVSQLAPEVAWVTPEGILFYGQYYSCRKALREGWFQRAQAEKPWMIRVLYNSEAGPHNGMYIESELFEPEYVCYSLTEYNKPSNAEDYQEKIRKLQQERREIAGSPIWLGP